MNTQSPLRHDYSLCDPATCYWCALDRESADDLRESFYDRFVGDEAR